jgi:hypothetical protein
VFGDRVRRVAEHREQASRRRGDHEPAAAFLQPGWHELLGGADVRHHVHLERSGPVVGGRVQAIAEVDARRV